MESKTLLVLVRGDSHTAAPSPRVASAALQVEVERAQRRHNAPVLSAYCWHPATGQQALKIRSYIYSHIARRRVREQTVATDSRVLGSCHE